MSAADQAVPSAAASDWLVCPECARPLEGQAAQLDCPHCERHWPVVDGVPQFVDSFPYWGEIPHDTMLAVNEKAAAGSWKTPLVETDDPVVRRAAEMILNLERANWQWLPDLPDTSRVLDLGAGCGTNSHALGLHFREVVAVEPVAERVAFMRHRFTQEGLDNIRLVRSSVWSLPFPEESFDFAAMNGVLEWVPEGRTEDPRRLQLEALRRIQRLLRPDGYLYVGIENRYAAGHFIGYRDPHCGIPFVTVLPRPLAHWYARRNGLPGYRNYLYSSRGYRKLLAEAGFTGYQCYLALPSYNHPRYFIRLEDNLFSFYSRSFQPQPRSLIKRVLQTVLGRAGVFKHLEYSFAIIARKAPQCR